MTPFVTGSQPSCTNNPWRHKRSQGFSSEGITHKNYMLCIWICETCLSNVNSSSWFKSQAMYSSAASVIRGHQDKSSERSFCKFSAMSSTPSSVTLLHPDSDRTVKFGNECTINKSVLSKHLFYRKFCTSRTIVSFTIYTNEQVFVFNGPPVHFIVYLRPMLFNFKNKLKMR